MGFLESDGSGHENYTQITFPEKIEEIIETHISKVYLGKKFVYKQKKPVNFGFIDYTSLASRSFFARKELSLNRRGCSGVYVDVLKLRRKKNRYGREVNFFGNKGGRVLDYFVRMRRVKPEKFLNNILIGLKANNTSDSSPEPSSLKFKILKAIAKKIYLFHKNAKSSRRISGFGSPVVYMDNWDDNFKSLEGLFSEHKSLFKSFKSFIGKLNDMENFYTGFISSLKFKKFSEDRINEGFIRDCHGDLRMEHISVSISASKRVSRVCLMDCIEFSEKLRLQDILLDTAFLLMDFEKKGYFFESLHFFKFYKDFFGSRNFFGPTSLKESDIISFFKAYRAVVRSKISLISGDFPKAISYLNYASFYVNIINNPPVFINVGLSGSGKTSLSRLISEYFYARHLRSDYFRQEMFGDIEKKIKYSKKAGEDVYSLMLNEGTEGFLSGSPVVFDATFLKSEHLKRFTDWFAGRASNIFIIYSKIPEEKEGVILDRLGKRFSGKAGLEEPQGGYGDNHRDYSEAGIEIYLRQKAGLEEPEPENIVSAGERGSSVSLITVDASMELEARFNYVMGELVSAYPFNGDKD